MAELTEEESTKILNFLNGKSSEELSKKEIAEFLQLIKAMEPQGAELKAIIQKLQQKL